MFELLYINIHPPDYFKAGKTGNVKGGKTGNVKGGKTGNVKGGKTGILFYVNAVANKNKNGKNNGRKFK